MRVNHEYDRGGALAYLAAYDVHRAHVIGLCSDTTGIVPFTDLVDEVMTQEPYASAKRVFWVVGNGSSHRGKAAIDRLTRRYPNAVMVHTPVHASWLNQVEIFFSIVQRKVVTPNDFTNLDQVQDRLTAFEHRYNATARPFRWKFTPADLEDLLTRIERHDHKPSTPTTSACPASGRLITPEELPARTTKYPIQRHYRSCAQRSGMEGQNDLWQCITATPSTLICTQG